MHRIAMLVSFLLSFSLTYMLPAYAHDFGLIKTDDGRVSYGSDESNDDHHLFWNHFVFFQSENEYQARTDLNMVEIQRFGWANGTDIVWFAANLADGTAGDESCRRTVGIINRTCDRARVRFNEDLTRNYPEIRAFELACHEFGHALGFEHRRSACMNTDIRGVGGSLNDHMIDHINDQY